MTDTLLFPCTNAGEDPERATLPFIAANVAAASGQEAVVLCTIEGVWLGTEGGTRDIAHPGMPTLADLYEQFVGNGGEVWLCGACTKPRNITEDQCAEGAQIVGAAMVVERVASGAKVVPFT